MRCLRGLHQKVGWGLANGTVEAVISRRSAMSTYDVQILCTFHKGFDVGKLHAKIHSSSNISD